MGVRDWSAGSPDARPCYLVALPSRDGSLCAVHEQRDVAELHAGKVGGVVIELPYFEREPAER